MKVACPNCSGKKVVLLLEGIYICKTCDKIFSIDSYSGIMIEEKEGIIEKIKSYPRPLKAGEAEYPHVFIKIGNKGISRDLLSKKILKIKGIKGLANNSVIKGLRIKM